MIALGRRTTTARSGIVAAVIGVLAVTSLSAAAASPRSAASTARASAPASLSPASGSEGHTKCVPWPKPASSGRKCTGTYSGGTAWNPWTWHSISQQPVVTVSQASDLTDQGVQVTWSDFTPSLDSTGYTPDPSTINPLYQVSIFECEGTNPNPGGGFGAPQCYTPPVGSSLTQASSGPANGLLENTLDTSSPPKNYSCPANSNYPDPSSVLCADITSASGISIPYKSKWDGGSPSTWTGQADFHVEAPTPRSQGGFFNCGPSRPCSLVIVPNWGGTPVYNSSTDEFSYTNTSLCHEHWLGEDADPNSGQFKYDSRTMLGDPDPYPNAGLGYDQGDLEGLDAPDNFPYGQADGLSGNGSVAPLQGASYACWAADRIVIPLSFAPTPSDCSNKTPAFYAQGSPMMETQMLQWQAGWCNGPEPVTLDYTSNSESVAREDFLEGSQVGGPATDMALVTLPATAAESRASRRRYTYAPLDNSGGGVAYLIDDPNTGSQINRLVLDPRLLAKLTTQSYTLQYGCTAAAHAKPSLTCDPAVWGDGKNAYSLFDDPEFLSLNRHCQPFGEPASYTCRNSSHGSSNGADDFPQDVTASGGTATGDFLPTVLEPDSDMTYDLTGYIAANSDAAAFLDGTPDQSGMRINSNYLHDSYPTQAFPVLDNGFTLPITCSGTGCPTDDQDVTMQASWNPQPALDTIALDLLTDQPTAASPTDDCPSINGCSNARELTLTSATPPQLIGSRDLLSELDLGDIAGYQFPAAEVVNAAGKAVGPTQASVEAAVTDMKTNPDGITQYYDYGNTDPGAYPLAMVDYAMVPTCGLSPAAAAAVADFLTKAATTGQVPGEAPGDLAPGYYPLNAKQKAQTLEAAAEVKAQDCASPPAHRSPADHTSTKPATGKKPHSGASPSASRSPGKTPPGGQRSPGSPARQAGTLAFGEKIAGSGLPWLMPLLAIILGVLLALGAPTAWVITVTGRWPVVLRGVRAVPARVPTGLGRLAGRVPGRAGRARRAGKP
jgi:hypothetical protein